jgi:hypothetical protein
VPCERERAKMNVGVERNFNHGELRREAPRVARRCGGLSRCAGSPGARPQRAQRAARREGCASREPPASRDRTRGALSTLER